MLALSLSYLDFLTAAFVAVSSLGMPLIWLEHPGLYPCFSWL
jgi:hypothetical protein